MHTQRACARTVQLSSLDSSRYFYFFYRLIKFTILILILTRKKKEIAAASRIGLSIFRLFLFLLFLSSLFHLLSLKSPSLNNWKCEIILARDSSARDGMTYRSVDEIIN